VYVPFFTTGFLFETFFCQIVRYAQKSMWILVVIKQAPSKCKSKWSDSFMRFADTRCNENLASSADVPKVI
jgi:hypothetical protein